MKWNPLPPILICSALLLASLVSLPAAAEVPSVIVDSFQVIPQVLMPGEKATITVYIRSSSAGTQVSSQSFSDPSSQVTSVTTTEVTPYIESIVLSDRDIRVLGGDAQFEGNIGPGQIIPVTFLIEAPPQSGLYFPDVLIRVRGGQSVKFPVPVNVNTQLSVMRTPSFIVQKVFPAKAKPGEVITGSLVVENAGQVRADSIRVMLLTDQLPVVTTGSSQYQIEHLDSGERAQVNFSILVDRNAGTGLAEVPVQISYRLLDGTLGMQNESLGLDIRGEAELGITALETSPLRIMGGQPFDLTIRIENTGTGDAKSVSAKVDLPFTGSREAFIGTIKPGNDAPAVFSLDAKGAGTYRYNTTITYTDDWGTRTSTRMLELVVYRNDGAWIGLVILGVLAAGGFIGYRYWKGKKGAN